MRIIPLKAPNTFRRRRSGLYRPLPRNRSSFVRVGLREGLLAACLIAPVLGTPALATIVVLAPHPDDAEASCGGTIANAVVAGEEVVILTMTGGELGVPGKPPDEARSLRAEEARRAAAALGARVEFFGATDGALSVDAAATRRLTESLAKLDPRLVLAPWPLDVHADHQASGILAWRAFQDARLRFDLYFYETCNAPHTTSFRFEPTDWVDISASLARKVAALRLHRSQGPGEWLDQYTVLARVRGYETDVDYAEGFIRARSSGGLGGRPGGVAGTLGGRH